MTGEWQNWTFRFRNSLVLLLSTTPARTDRNILFGATHTASLCPTFGSHTGNLAGLMCTFQDQSNTSRDSFRPHLWIPRIRTRQKSEPASTSSLTANCSAKWTVLKQSLNSSRTNVRALQWSHSWTIGIAYSGLWMLRHDKLQSIGPHSKSRPVIPVWSKIHVLNMLIKHVLKQLKFELKILSFQKE